MMFDDFNPIIPDIQNMPLHKLRNRNSFRSRINSNDLSQRRNRLKDKKKIRGSKSPMRSSLGPTIKPRFSQNRSITPGRSATIHNNH